MKVFSAQVMQLLRGVILLVVLMAAQPVVWRIVVSSAATLQEKRTIEQQTAALRERLAAIEAVVADQTPLLEDLGEVFPPLAATSTAVERIEQLADRHNITLTVENIREDRPLGPLNRSILVPLTMTVAATGAADKLLEYIEAVEHVPEVTAIDEWVLDVTDKADTDNPQRHRLTLNVMFYFQPTVNGK